MSTILFIAVATHSALAQGAIRGRVVDQDGRPVAGAQVALTPTTRRVISAEDGAFVFVNLGATTYTVAVRRLGYQPFTMSAAVGDSTIVVSIALTSIPRQLDSVVIRERSAGIRYSATVLDQSDQPVSGAEVIAMGINGRIQTDSLGRFFVPKLARGTLTLRLRKIGYTALFGSLLILSDRLDTLRMQRVSQSLSTVEVREQSGFGSDYWAYRELDQRMTWKGAMAGAISREELDSRGNQDLCDAIPGTATGAKLSLHNFFNCKKFPEGVQKVLIDGVHCDRRLLSDFTADQIELLEFVPRGGDLSGSLQARNCAPPVYVLWMRHR